MASILGAVMFAIAVNGERGDQGESAKRDPFQVRSGGRSRRVPSLSRQCDTPMVLVLHVICTCAHPRDG